MIGLLLPSFTLYLCYLLWYSVNFYHSSAPWSNIKSDSLSTFWFIDLYSVYLIIASKCLSTTMSILFPMLNLPPVRYNIPTYVVIYFVQKYIYVMESFTIQWSWYYDELLYVLFLCTLMDIYCGFMMLYLYNSGT